MLSLSMNKSETELSQSKLSTRPTGESDSMEQPPLANDSWASSSYPDVERNFILTQEMIREPAELALSISKQFQYVPLAIQCYVHMMEFHMLITQQKQTALDFFDLFVHHFKLFYCDGIDLLLPQKTPSSLLKLQGLLERVVRFLLFQDTTIINRNLDLIDIYLKLQNLVRSSQLIVIPSDVQKFIFSDMNDYSKMTQKKKTGFAKNITIDMKKSVQQINIKDTKETTAESKRKKKFVNKLHGYFYFMKRQVKNHVDGQILLDVLADRNKDCIRRLLRLCNIYRANDLLDITVQNTIRYSRSARLRPAPEQSHKDYEYSTELKENDIFNQYLESRRNAIARVLHILKLNQYCAIYAPLLGETRFQRINTDNFNSENLVRPTKRFYLMISLKDHAQSITLRASGSATLKSLKELLLTMNGTKKRKSKGTISPLSLSLVTKKPQTFFEKLATDYIITKYEDDPGRTKKIASVSTFLDVLLGKYINEERAKIVGYDYVSLDGCDEIPLYKFFTESQISNNSQENPVKLYVHLPSDPCQDFINPPSDTLVEILRNMVLKYEVNPRSHQLVIKEMKSTYHELYSVIKKLRKDTREIDHLFSPFVLVCSKEFQSLPWEFLFSSSSNAVRTFTLSSYSMTLKVTKKEFKLKKNLRLMGKRQKSVADIKKESKDVVATLYKFYIFYESNRNEGVERYRLQKSIDGATAQFFSKVTGSEISDIAIRQAPQNSPFVNQVSRVSTYKNRYKFSSFYTDSSPESLSKDIFSSDNPCFIFSYADLFDMSEALLFLTRSSRPVTMVFAPSSLCKTVLARLCAAQKDLRYDDMSYKSEILLTTLRAIEKEYQAPICVFNPLV
eukprot:TRINITY_DN5701_c0_g1_i2.p1 TRINITY_DN5701_c0_g1~~TRINITY_DN5701_c0_g1_i2.p1  ORF type:complete len:847 (-),score=132.74 TRINITY_DN5701_c0_g1_i2:61-2601(-)